MSNKDYRINIKDFFNNGYIYKVPEYQRKYVWNGEMAKALFEDIFNLSKSEKPNKTLYLGNVLIKIDSQGVYWLIDGQQRTTTFMLIFKALKDYYIENGGDENSPLIKGKPHGLDEFVWKKEVGDKTKRLKLTDLLNSSKFKNIFEEVILLDEVSNVKLFKQKSQFHSVYYDLRRKIQKLLESDSSLSIKKFIETLERVWVVRILLEEGDDELSIFESLNSKGTSLSSADLIKNFFFIKLREANNNKSNKEIEQEIKDFFEKDLYETISNWEKNDKKKDSEIRSFIKEYIIVKTARSSSNEIKALSLPAEKETKDLYNKFKLVSKDAFNNLKTNDDIKKCIYDLKRLLNIKNDLKEYKTSIKKWNEEWQLSLMSFNDYYTGSQFFPIIAQLFDKEVNYTKSFDWDLTNQGFKDSILFLEKMIVRRAFAGLGTRLLVRTIEKINVKTYDDLKREFNAKDGFIPSDYDFKEGMKGNVYKTLSSNVLKPVLWRLENSFAKTTNNENINNFTQKSKIQIEHVLPQNIKVSKEWQDELGKDWSKDSEELVHTFGNLTLTANNPNMSNGTFKDKVLFYKEGFIKMNDKIAECKKWDRNSIEKRTVELIDKSMNIWK